MTKIMTKAAPKSQRHFIGYWALTVYRLHKNAGVKRLRNLVEQASRIRDTKDGGMDVIFKDQLILAGRALHRIRILYLGDKGVLSIFSIIL